MQQLTGIDAAFLFGESARSPMHIGSVNIWDPSTAPGGKVRFKRIIQTLTERAHLAPYLRQRLFEVPYNADFPFWVKDDTFDPEFHVRHIALPKPGDWRQLCIMVSRIHARQLDRSRPLWELYVIEGLDNVEGVPPGSFAYLSKTHHAAIDGTASNDIGNAMCDPSPEIRLIPGGESWVADKPPSPFELATIATQNNILKPQRYMEFLKNAVPAWSNTLESIASGQLQASPEVPRTRFNGVVSPYRVFEGVIFSLDEVRAIKSEAGGTVNDVMLAICSGALRNYLLEKHELPDKSLVSQCPINIRNSNDKISGGNEISSMAVALRTDISDAKTRLLAICEETRASKQLAQAIGAKMMVDMANLTPSHLAAMGARTAAEQGLANYMQPTFNTIITNVPGSRDPIYSNGAVQLRAWGTGPCTDGNGLFHSVVSYQKEITIGVSCCRDMMPDPSHYASLLRRSFAELKEGILGKETLVAEKSAPKKSSPKSTAAKKPTKTTGKKP